MTVTYSGTGVGTGAQPYRTVVRNSLICHAATNSEALTLVHGLGACPTEVRFALRSVVTAISGYSSLDPQILTHNASQTTVAFGNPNTTAKAAMFDIIMENTHSLVA